MVVVDRVERERRQAVMGLPILEVVVAVVEITGAVGTVALVL
jgi:hypothetical protein